MFEMKQTLKKNPSQILVTKIYSVSISEQLLFNVYAIDIPIHYKDIKIYKFPNPALQLPSALIQICLAEHHDLSPHT